MAVEVTQILSTVINSTTTSSAVTVPSGESVSVFVRAGGVSGTTPSFTFEVQWSNDGVDWFSNDGTADSFAAITSSKNVCKAFTPKGRMARVSVTVTGTSPSGNFTVNIAGQETNVVQA